MNTYLTSDGDTVDRIAFRTYGSLEGQVVERVLLANPGLADRGPALPAGVAVSLPVLDAAVTAKTTGHKLWA
jgi:phage tail protein X